MSRWRWLRRWRWLAAAAGGGMALLAAGWLALPPPALDRARDLSTLVLARDGSILRGFLSADGKWRLPVAPGAVSPLYQKMLIAIEDRRFAWHPGVDPMAVLRATGQLIVRERVVSGASTLTMQAVRLLERRPRTLAAKLAEMGEALALERRLTKPQILGLYETLAPFGGNLEGVRAASLAYFGKEPKVLTPAQAALLVAIPRSPEKLRPDRHPAAARAARDAVLRRLAARGAILHREAAEAAAEDVPRHRLAMPFRAPHLARELHDATPAATSIATTIDPLLQDQAAALLRRSLAGLDPHATIAALVVDNRSRRIVADIGSAEFASAARRGAIDMTRAVRSPGSALKPFIYAMAFDRLILHPETLLNDAPRHFGGYAPVDFDGRFQGRITAREALQYSLNVPAVAVLDRLGPARFMAALAAVGVRLHLPGPATRPDLPIALGGDGITLRDMVTLFAGLADGGVMAPLRDRAGTAPPPGTRMFGRVAAWYVADILTGAPPPPGVVPADLRSGRRLAYKTGTSYGYRDCWAVGFDRDVTIGVWVGRADGTPMPGSSGRTTAAPVLFKIADLLGPPTLPPEPGPPPPGAVVTDNRALPPRLRTLDPGPREAAGDPGGPHIVYPPNGALIAWRGHDVPLEAVGGARPLRWLADERPLPPEGPHRAMLWHPGGIGFTRLTVIDAAGRSASATVRLSR